jgi:MFS family permease
MSAQSLPLPGDSIVDEEPELIPKGFYASKRSLTAVLSLQFLGAIGFTMVLPSLWPYLQSMGGDSMHLGLTVAAYSLGQFMASPVAGFLYNRLPSGVVFALLIALDACGNLAYALVRSVWTIIIARFVVGLAASSTAVCRAWSSDATHPASRLTVMSLVNVAQALAFIVGPSIGGLAGSNSEFQIRWKIFLFNAYTWPGYIAVFMDIVQVLLLIFLFRECIRVKEIKWSKKAAKKSKKARKEKASLKGEGEGRDPSENSPLLTASKLAVQQLAFNLQDSDKANGMQLDGDGVGTETDSARDIPLLTDAPPGSPMPQMHYPYESPPHLAALGDPTTPNGRHRSSQQINSPENDPHANALHRTKDWPAHRHLSNLSAPELENEGEGESPPLGVIEELIRKPFRTCKLLLLLVSFHVCIFVFAVFETIATPMMRDDFGLSVRDAGLMFSFAGIVALGGFVLLRLLSIFISERVLLPSGWVLLILSMGGFLRLLGELDLIRFTLALALLSATYPCVQILIFVIYSRVVGDSLQGVFMGVLTAAGSLARIFGPLYATGMWSLWGTTNLVFIGVALMMVAVLAFTIALVPWLPGKPPKMSSSEKEVEVSVPVANDADEQATHAHVVEGNDDVV